MDGLYSVLTPTQASSVTACAFTRNTHINHHHVALVLSNKTGNLLASATNVATPTGSIHAEVAAMRQLRHRLRDRALFGREVKSGVRVLSLRLGPSGNLLLAKPCCRCSQEIRRCPLVKSVLWSDSSGGIVKERIC